MADIQGRGRGLLLGVLFVAAAVLVFLVFRPAGKKNVVEKGLDAKEAAAEAQTRANLQGVETAVVAYMADAGAAPASLAALQNLRLLPAGAIDGWGRTIRYERISDSSFRVISAGKDGAFGTGDDIVREY
jgi:hypothetical protein